MRTIIIAVALATAAIASSASAQTRYRDYRDYQDRPLYDAPVAMRYHRNYWRQPGPPWAGPNQCFEDLGYGRYESCDSGR